MSEARVAKTAVVEEVRERFSDSDSLVLTEYRNLDVPAMASLREALREVGGDYKVYKNTLVRFAIEDLDLEIDDLLSCLLYTSPSPRDGLLSRMPSSA